MFKENGFWDSLSDIEASLRVKISGMEVSLHDKFRATNLCKNVVVLF